MTWCKHGKAKILNPNSEQDDSHVKEGEGLVLWFTTAKDKPIRIDMSQKILNFRKNSHKECQK